MKTHSSAGTREVSVGVRGVSIEPGTLYVVATPIGNLGDITRRAVAVLDAVELILAEDTRHSQRLLTHLGLSRRLLSLHEHNESERVEAILSILAEGSCVALISDAGTPLISDPGYRLVRAAQQQGHTVSPVPGPCSPIAALSVSGLPTDRFAFEGFLPGRASARRARLEQLSADPRTLVFLESPHRVGFTLADLVGVFGADREAAIARELTKLHEHVIRSTLGDLLDRAARSTELSRGELVLVVRGAESSAQTTAAETRRLLGLLSTELPPARVAALAAKITGQPRRELYALLQALMDTR